MDIAQAKEQLKALDFLIGAWRTEGSMLTGDPQNPVLINGTDTYRLTLDECFIEHKADVMMDNDHIKVLEIIGNYDETAESFKMYSFDSQNTVSEMNGKLKNNLTLLIEAVEMRATLTAETSGNTMKAHWERQSPNGWQAWMDLTFNRI